VTGDIDFYSLLKIPRDADADTIKHAYRNAALESHPDTNKEEGATERFLLLTRAYEVLTDPELRSEYDAELAEEESKPVENASYSCQVLSSRKSLLQLAEPQVHYLLVDIMPSENIPVFRPPINVCIVIDKSTSMRGPRLDQVRSATIRILDSLEENDRATVISFSDKAELVVSADQAQNINVARARLSLLQAGGGTEIGQGMYLGMEYMQQNFLRDGVNHLVLLTDGRTYGDEDLCLSLARKAASLGITINSLGIGPDWNDLLLDDISSKSGGNVLFLDSPTVITALLSKIFRNLERVVANRVTIDGSFAQQVDLRSTFRLEPDPLPLGDQFPLLLGHLPREGRIRLLLEMVIHPIGKISHLEMAHFTVDGDILGANLESVPLNLRINIPVSDKPDMDPPPQDISQAIGRISLYEMQEKARHEAEIGQAQQAARRLENLATQLLAAGERDLAKAALNEAARVTHTRKFSSQGGKFLKYGTRALLLPAKTEDP